MKSKFISFCLCLVVALSVNSADSPLHVMEKSKDSRLFTTPYFALYAPSSLLYHVNQSGSSLSFEVSYRQSMAGFGITISPLQSVNGYETKWNDLEGYFRFIKTPMNKRKVGSYEWGYLGTEDQTTVDKTFFKIHNSQWVQISYRYPTTDQVEYCVMFEGMLKSLKLSQ